MPCAMCHEWGFGVMCNGCYESWVLCKLGVMQEGQRGCYTRRELGGMGGMQEGCALELASQLEVEGHKYA